MPPENNPPPADDCAMAQTVVQSQRNTAFMRAILDVYEDLDRAGDADENRTLCLGGGACCRFDLFDHRLYATTGELAVLTRARPIDPSRLQRDRCPYQQGPRCLARENRPLGCRVFFCRESSQAPDTTDSSAYETFHRRICELHEEYNVPYAYVELISALKILHEFCH